MIKSFVCGMIMNNCYVMNKDDSKKAFIVDPGAPNKNLESYLIGNQLDIEYIVLTHGHSDHTGGVARILELYPQAKVIAGKKELKLLSDRHMSFANWTVTPDLLVVDDEEMNLCGFDCKFIETPGHTPGGICIYIASEKVLFSGDTLFQCSIGRTDFIGGSYNEIMHSIKEKLFLLPDDTQVLCGHEGATTIANEKRYNPFVN